MSLLPSPKPKPCHPLPAHQVSPSVPAPSPPSGGLGSTIGLTQTSQSAASIAAFGQKISSSSRKPVRLLNPIFVHLKYIAIKDHTVHLQEYHHFSVLIYPPISTEAAVIRNAGGRAMDAIRSLIVLDSVINLGTIIVVHHTGK